jgi:signal transduction histidine kinase
LIHGLPPEAANETHEDWVRRIHPEDRIFTEKRFRDAVEGNERGYAIQYRIIRPCDGEVRWISAKTEIERDENGKAVRLVGAHADVTDQVLAEQAVRQSEEKFRNLAGELSRSLDQLRAAQNRLIQTEKLASLGQLTAGIAHEIKNPLNFINNFSGLSFGVGRGSEQASWDCNARSNDPSRSRRVSGHLERKSGESRSTWKARGLHR